MEVVSVATFSNGLEMKLNQQETDDLVKWLGNPNKKDFLELGGGAIRQEPLVFLSYEKWIESKGLYLCSQKVEHRKGTPCNCYVQINKSNVEEIPSITAIAEEALSKPGRARKLMIAGMRKTNPRLADHIEKGGSFSNFPNGIKTMHEQVNPQIDRSKHHEWVKVQREYEERKLS